MNNLLGTYALAYYRDALIFGMIGLFLYNKELYIAKYYSTENNTILIFLDKNQTTLVFKSNDQPENLGKLFTFI